MGSYFIEDIILLSGIDNCKNANAFADSDKAAVRITGRAFFVINQYYLRMVH